AVAVLPQRFCVVAFVRYQLAASLTGPTSFGGNVNTVQQGFSMGNIAGLSTGEDEMQWHTSGVADHVNFRCQPTPASSECVVRWFFRPPFWPAPDEARDALTAVESMHQVSKSIRP